MERKLTKTENNTLQLASKGLTDKEIARIRGISFYTVKNCMQNIYFKTNTRNRTEAVAYGFKHNLLHGIALFLVLISALSSNPEQLRPRQTRNPHSTVRVRRQEDC